MLYPQALGRRYRSRAFAIRLAQARITKYIDPKTRLPYWQHPGTGIISWSKPKIFGLEDVDHATMVATKKTEHLVSGVSPRVFKVGLDFLVEWDFSQNRFFFSKTSLKPTDLRCLDQ